MSEDDRLCRPHGQVLSPLLVLVDPVADQVCCGVVCGVKVLAGVRQETAGLVQVEPSHVDNWGSVGLLDHRVLGKRLVREGPRQSARELRQRLRERTNQRGEIRDLAGGVGWNLVGFPGGMVEFPDLCQR
ncbi:MAG: hypothetical protein ABIQ15_11475 [Nocardioides sp.]